MDSAFHQSFTIRENPIIFELILFGIIFNIMESEGAFPIFLFSLFLGMLFTKMFLKLKYSGFLIEELYFLLRIC